MLELNCKWHFDEANRGAAGKDATSATFNQPYYSIVRESLQNALDAARYEDKPVEVHFDRITISKSDFPNFFQLEQHLIQCREFVNYDVNTKDWVERMLNYIQNHPSLTCLKISDFNTKGMSWMGGANDSPFKNFIENIGLSAGKGAGAQGSFGFGKGAYFALSPISTVLVSTVDENNQPVFEGVTKITTHEDGKGRKLREIGFYDNQDSNPILDRDFIPELFRREETGTDFIIVGYYEEEDDETQIVKSVLNNFWFPLLSNRLKVNVFGKEINAQNVYTTACQYFPEETETCSIKEYLLWNPRPYIRCVLKKDSGKKYKSFYGKGKEIGDMKLYVYRNPELPDRIAYCRKPKMVVKKETKHKLAGYVAVFVCENERGDNLLKAIENQSHDEWDKKNLKSNAFTQQECETALKEINDFINGSLESLNPAISKKVAYFEGLEDYFSTAEDLLDNEESYDNPGMTKNDSQGEPSETPSDDETGYPDTTIKDTTKKNPIISEGTYVPDSQNTENVSDDPQGNPYVSGHTHTGDDDDDDQHPYPGSGGKPANKKPDKDSNEQGKRLVRIHSAVSAHRDENNNLFHTIVIDSPEEVLKTEIDLHDNTDNGTILQSSISECYIDGEEIILSEKSIISGIKLKKGENRIEVAFDDNLKHSIKIQAYEIE